LYGGVLQGDWHLDQIMLINLSDWEPLANNQKHDFSVVFLDFAFTHLRLGETNFVEAFPENDQLFIELWDCGLPPSLLEDLWFPFDDYEV